MAQVHRYEGDGDTERPRRGREDGWEGAVQRVHSGQRERSSLLWHLVDVGPGGASRSCLVLAGPGVCDGGGERVTVN